MSWPLWTKIAIFILLLVDIDGARILAYFPTPSISHQVVFRHVTKELAKRGHEVTVITTDPLPKEEVPANLTEIDVHDVSYKHWEELFLVHTGNRKDVNQQINIIFEKMATTIKIQMDTPAVQKALSKKHKKYFDLLLLEAMYRPLLGIGHMFDAPIVHISSFGGVPSMYGIYGAPTHPLLYPTASRQRSYNLTLWEKAVELFRHLALEYKISSMLEFDYQEMKKAFGNDIPSIEQLASKIKLLLLNEHPIWASNRPVPPNIEFIGGIHQSEEKELPYDLKSYLDSSKHGVIYVSFGTNVLPSLLPPEKIRIMTKVFSQLPYDILWKWDKEVLPGKSNNTKIGRWFPQSDLLKHPNVKLFITQGGLQSADETINAAVPVIGMPMLGDQWFNVENYVHHKVGLQLDVTTLTEEEFRDAVLTVINDKSFKNNIVRLRSLMRSFPIRPLDKAVWLIEHIIEYGGDHLQTPSRGLTLAEYYEINLILVFLFILLIISVTVACALKVVLSIVVPCRMLFSNLKA
ncbi:UDP-glucosyltransferase 2-like [Melitaea cinxia]|uniref:UDP-glucosyltransferase 2-like n=1 Tax=Melitaea cinxia TaxID=113334 RepID=UPI001E270DC6|nr:UDP-glucosyltransferase 2-like [Melitaea cinxia]